MFCRRSAVCLFFVISSLLASSQSAPYQFTQHDSQTASGRLSVVRADFNNDSIPDLATANRDENTVSVLLMNSDGTVRSRHDYAVGDSPMALVAADFNHDHEIDIVTTNADSDDVHTISVLLGNGDGTLQPAKFSLADICLSPWPAETSIATATLMSPQDGDKLQAQIPTPNSRMKFRFLTEMERVDSPANKLSTIWVKSNRQERLTVA